MTGRVIRWSVVLLPLGPVACASANGDPGQSEENARVLDEGGSGGMGTGGGSTDPGVAGSGTASPGTTAPGTGGSSTTDPGTTDPGVTDPGTTDPGTMDPDTSDPGTTDPTDPGTTDPTDPGTTDPTDPGTTDPTDPGTTDPTDPGTTDPGTTDPVEPTDPATPHCMDGISSYTETGPFSYDSTSSGEVNMWIPDVPSGCKVPVVHLANGTGARCSTYGSILEHLASHGFLATCYEDTNTGQGTQCITALETAFAEYPDLADNKIGSTGHSQGGGAAIVCVYRAEEQWGDSMTYAGHAMEPAHGYGDAPSDYASLYAQVDSPIFMFNGSQDSLVSASWVGRGFDALNDSTEAYWYEAQGAAHIPIPASWTEESTVAWFRWKLLGDAQACEYFKNMPNTSEWEFMESQNEGGC